MADLIHGHLYRIGLDSEYNYRYISAEDPEDLMRFLVKEYASKRSIYGVKEIRKDGSIHPVAVTAHPYYQKLLLQKMREERYIPTEIDGQLWAVMLPTGGTDPDDPFNQWDKTCRSIAHRNDLFHYHTIFSICQDPAEKLEEHCVTRGCVSCRHRSDCLSTLRRKRNGYRPVLMPLHRDTLLPDENRLTNLRDGSTISFGTLYMDQTPLNNPQNPHLVGDVPDYMPDASLQIRNTSPIPEQTIHWIKVDNYLISDRNLIKDLSWDDLNRQGLVFGKQQESNIQAKKPSITEQCQKAEIKKIQQGRGEHTPVTHITK